FAPIFLTQSLCSLRLCGLIAPPHHASTSLKFAQVSVIRGSPLPRNTQYAIGSTPPASSNSSASASPLPSLSHLFAPIFLPPLLSGICAPCIKIRAHPVPSVVNSH